MKRIFIVALLALFGAASCAVIGGGVKVDDPTVEGKTWSVWGSNEKWAFNHADQLCPYGYYVLGERPNTVMPPFHLLEIKCKLESSGQVDLVLNPDAGKIDPNGIGRVGQYSYEIERMPEVLRCNAKPLALLASKSIGMEMYGVQCSNGRELKVKCDVSGCVVVQ